MENFEWFISFFSPNPQPKSGGSQKILKKWTEATKDILAIDDNNDDEKGKPRVDKTQDDWLFYYLFTLALHEPNIYFSISFASSFFLFDFDLVYYKDHLIESSCF